MLQGTGSDVGKSLLVAGLCRAALRRGLRVRPFKPQNMSNNAGVAADGGEIGRAQMLQARACGVPPSHHMNPVLLKPNTETGSQIVVQGKAWQNAEARAYSALKPKLMAPVLESFERLRAEADLVIVEGAGSPAEVNLRAGDIANMGFAVAADVPVVLVGDIHRGGVIAQVVGTKAVISPQDARQIAGFMINKFRGDVSLFDDGYALIRDHTGWPGFGVVPWFDRAHLLPAEDAVSVGQGRGTGLKVACPMLSRIANFDDLDPLAAEPGVEVVMVRAGEPLPGDADVVILPGSKSTRGDLTFLRAQGWDVDLAAHLRRGGHVLGLCGGYQMLGRSIADPGGLEGPAGTTEGLGLLEVETVLEPEKRVEAVTARHTLTGTSLTAYEIHVGRTEGPARARPFAESAGQPEGARDATGRVQGTYLHGLFSDDTFRAAWLKDLGADSTLAYDETVEQVLDALADHMETHCDVAVLLAAAR
ncbi:MAG: cobyric acid synthase [Pseudomonadota bacterium]